MNSFIETLNQWGGNFLSFAWPMFWQSSLLIAVLFAFDILLRRKIRASIRYALWLVVLVKLCVPPTLALPTSPAWWLHKTSTPIVAKPETRFTVTYDNAPLPEIPQTPPPVFVPPKPAMTFAAWLLAISVAVSLSLLGWLLARWWQITRQVHRAKSSERLAALAGEAQKIVGMKSEVQMKLTTNSMSPAVCGLFRPAILIPQPLAENFSDGQLHAVLLHELIHLCRRDVWLNFAQALLQIFYWWHPLVWLANARIRRVREEAVDDAVMLALRDEAESYAPTLLEVAKLALNRPLAGLGLVGILESRHALRQRIERLVDFHPPRKAGLTLASLLGILAFTAVAVPMGEGPAQTNNPASPVVSDDLNQTNPSISTEADLSGNTNIVHDWIMATFKINDPMDGNKLKKILQDAGVKMPPTVYFYMDNGILLVRGSKEQVALVNRVMLKLNGFPQKDIKATDRQFISQFSAAVSAESTATNLFQRTFKVDANIFPAALQKATGLQTTNVSTMARSFFSDLGVDFDLPGKSIVFNDKLGLLFVKATNPDLDLIERTIQALYSVAPRNRPVATNSSDNQTKADQMVQDGKLLYEMGRLEEAQAKLDEALKLDPDSEAAFYYKNLVRQAGYNRNEHAHTTATNGLIYTGPGRAEIMNKLNSYHLSVSYDPAVPLREVIRDLRRKIEAMDPTKKPMNFIINNLNEASSENIDPNTGLPVDIGSYLIKLNLKDARLADVLDAICMVANNPNHPDEHIKYSIMDYGIVFLLKDQSPALFERTFKVDNATFISVRQKATGLQTTNVSTMARSFFSDLGVDFDLPGKSVVYNDKLGLLFVRATNPDLDTIERAIQALSFFEPQIHIKARFVELTQDDSKTSGTDWYLGDFDVNNNVAGKGGSSPSSAVPVSAANPLGNFPGNMTSNVVGLSNPTHMAGQITGILADTNYRVVLHALQSLGKSKMVVLGEPEGTTTSGRQMQMRATKIINVITNFNYQENEALS